MNIKVIGKVLVKYAPQILAGISAGATIGAVVSAADVGFKQGRKSEDECKLTDWTVPATLTVIAVATNLASATLGYKRQMSVIAAYAALEKKFQNYKNDVADIAPEVDDLITHEHIMQQRKEREDKQKSLTEYYDFWTGQTFFSTPEDIDHALSVIQNNLNESGYARILDFYEDLDVLDQLVLDEEERVYGWEVCDTDNIILCQWMDDKFDENVTMLRFMDVPTLLTY